MFEWIMHDQDGLTDGCSFGKQADPNVCEAFVILKACGLILWLNELKIHHCPSGREMNEDAERRIWFWKMPYLVTEC